MTTHYHLIASWQKWRLLVCLLACLSPFIPFSKLELNTKSMMQSAHRGVTLGLDGYDAVYRDASQIDILLIESSGIAHSLDRMKLQKLFLENSNRNLNIVSLPINSRGSEIQALLFKDLIERRKVKLAVIELNTKGQAYLHHATCFNAILPVWWELLQTQSLSIKVNLFGCSILSGLRNIYTSLDSKIAPYKRMRTSFTSFRWKRSASDELPLNPALEMEINRYADGIHLDEILTWPDNLQKLDLYDFDGALEAPLLREIVRLAKNHGVQLVGLSSPMSIGKTNKVLIEKKTQQLLLDNKIPIIAITLDSLRGIPFLTSLEQLFMEGNTTHMNNRGQAVVTPIYYRALASLSVSRISYDK